MHHELRIVSKVGDRSAVWRYSGEGKQARNYYLLVEAFNETNSRLSIPVKSEETGEVLW